VRHLLICALTIAAPAAAQAPDGLATASLQQARSIWHSCLDASAKQWAAGNDSAEAIADGSLYRCKTFEANIKAAHAAYFAEGGIGGAIALQEWNKQLPAMRDDARRRAIAAVLDSRASATKPAAGVRPKRQQ
jgi:hypothetical protein